MSAKNKGEKKQDKKKCGECSVSSSYANSEDAKKVLLAFQKYLGAAEQIDIDLATLGTIAPGDIGSWCNQYTELKSAIDQYVQKYGSKDRFPFGTIGEYQNTLNSLWNRAIPSEQGKPLSLGPLISSGKLSEVKIALESSWNTLHKLPPLF